MKRFDGLVGLMVRISDSYATASDENRRALNRFWFKALYIVEDEIVDQQASDLTSFVLDDFVPATSASPKWQHREFDATLRTKTSLARDQRGNLTVPLKMKEPRPSCDLGSNVDVLVGQRVWWFRT